MLYNFTCNLSFTDIQLRNTLVAWLMTNIPFDSLTKTFQFDTTYEGYHTLNIILNLEDEALRNTIFDYATKYQSEKQGVTGIISKHLCGLDSEPCSDLISMGGGVNE